MSSEPAILCPLLDRRNPRELYVKFFVVHFTTIVAFCHLMSIRKEKILTRRLLFYILVPYNFLVQHALAVLIIVCNALYLFVQKSPAHGRRRPISRSSRTAKYLFLNVQHFFGLSPPYITSSPPWSVHKQNAAETEPEQRAKMVGRLVIQGAFLTQCITAIVLYNRRRRFGAVALIDQLVFEIACGGVLVAVLTAGHILLNPLGRRGTQLPSTASVEAIQLLVSKSHFSYDYKFLGVDVRRLSTEVKDSYLSFEVIRLGYHCGFYPPFFMVGDIILPIQEVCMVLCISFIFFSSQPKADMSNHRESRFHRRIVSSAGINVKLMPLLILMMAVGTSLSINWNLITEVSAFKTLPEDVACPKAWKDPSTDYVWWLA